MSYYQSAHNAQGQAYPFSQYPQPDQNGSGYVDQSQHPHPHSHPHQTTYAGTRPQPDPYTHAPPPVQQPQSGYYGAPQSPRRTATWSQQQSPVPTYNPQHYAHPHHAQQHQPTYNPQTYAQHPPYRVPHSNTTYSDSSFQGTATGPVDPYAFSPAYSPSIYSATEPNSSPQLQRHGSTPQSARPASTHYSPQQPSHSFSYAGQAQPSPPPPHGHYYQPPSHPPAQPPYPNPDYGRTHSHSTSNTYAPQQTYTSTSPALPGVAHTAAGLPTRSPSQMTEHRQSPSPLYHTTSEPSYGIPSPPSGVTPGPTPPAHGFPVRQNPRYSYPASRPLPGVPEPDVEPDYFQGSNMRTSLIPDEEDPLTQEAQEELFSQVEHAVLAAGGSSSTGAHYSPAISVTHPPYVSGSQPSSVSAPGMQHAATQLSNDSAANGHLSPAPRQAQSSDDSDAEATQGLAMMQAAEEEDARRESSGNQLRFSAYGSVRDSRPAAAGAERGSDSEDYGNVDMSSFGGGYDVQMTYGGDPNQRAIVSQGLEPNGETHANQVANSQHSSMRRSHASHSSQTSRGEYDYQPESIHPFPPFNPDARVDASGTGGLSEPTGLGRRQSYDEGDEFSLMDSGQLPDRFPDEPPDIFYQPAQQTYSSGRPLPPPPGHVSMPPLYTDLKGAVPGQIPYPLAPDVYQYRDEKGNLVPRSTSLVNARPSPAVDQPLRSKTDAEERRRLRASGAYSQYDQTPATTVLPDLPSLGAKRFMPNRLGAPDFKKCEEPWSLGSILAWLLEAVSPEQYTELKEAEVKDALVALFTNKVPTMNITDAEGLSNRVVQDMYQAGALTPTEEWVKLVPGVFMSGVIFQLSGAGCYSPTLHDHIVPGRCYSHHCQRTLKKVNLQNHPDRHGESWAEFYKLKKEDVEGKDKKELERQNVLHEIVQTEDIYMEQLNVLRTVYRDPLGKAEPSIISPKRQEKFLRDVFGKIDAVRQANEEHLLPQLKYRQLEQGPWIIGFSDIFRQWIRKAKTAYLEYAGSFPGANFLVRREIDLNINFRNFIDAARNDRRGGRLGWDTYLKAPITRLQRYTLLLQTVLKNIRIPEGEARESSNSMGSFLEEEKRNLKIAVEEVKTVTLECDTRVAEMQRKVDLSDLSMRLILRSGMQNAVELNLDHFGRELIHRGDLQRMGDSRFTWVDTHALLFDHYMVIAKTLSQKSDQGGKVEKYDVSRLPIPMDLLILESANDPAVQKSNYVKVIASVSTVTNRTTTPADPALARTQSNQVPANIQHVNTGSSSNSLQTVNSLGQESKDSDKILYPFKVKHLGRDTYELFAATEQARRDWCNKIVEAKTKHAAALYAQNAEPFKLRVMADSAFVYDAFGSGQGKSVLITGTPVHRAIQEAEYRFKDTGRPGPICRARVNCATSFTTAYGAPTGVRHMVAVGTDFGVYVTEMDNPRGWTKAIHVVKVTQVAVLEDFNLFLLISDRVLIAYHLDAIVPNDRSGATPTPESAQKAPQRLSGSKEVGFFTSGKMKDRALVFYKKRENLSSVFKVLEPVYQKSTEKKRGMFKRGVTEFFREYDEFYIPAECSGMNLFHSSLAVSTARGFEVLTLERKQTWSVPDLKAPEVQNIAGHIKDQKALSMLRLSEQEFLLVYSDCAVYVNKHGDVSRSVIMDFVGTAQSAALSGAYLILFDNDFVEIRNAQNGRLKQIIAGREIKCLDDGGGGSSAYAQDKGGVNGVHHASGQRTVKFVMQHPELERTQIVVELLLNENMKE